MATITEFTSVSDEKWFEQIDSAFGLVADTIELTNPVNRNLPHCFIGIQQFDAGGNAILAGAGTYAISVRTVNSEVFEELPQSPIDATAPCTLNFAANVKAVRAVPTGVTTAVTYKLVLSANGN